MDVTLDIDANDILQPRVPTSTPARAHVASSARDIPAAKDAGAQRACAPPSATAAVWGGGATPTALAPCLWYPCVNLAGASSSGSALGAPRRISALLFPSARRCTPLRSTFPSEWFSRANTYRLCQHAVAAGAAHHTKKAMLVPERTVSLSAAEGGGGGRSVG